MQKVSPHLGLWFSTGFFEVWIHSNFLEVQIFETMVRLDASDKCEHSARDFTQIWFIIYKLGHAKGFNSIWIDSYFKCGKFNLIGFGE